MGEQEERLVKGKGFQAVTQKQFTFLNEEMVSQDGFFFLPFYDMAENLITFFVG